MNILWITNSIAFPDICKALKIPEPQTGGWMKSMLESLKKLYPHLHFAIATLHEGTRTIIKKQIHDTIYYLIPGKPSIKYQKSIEKYWEKINVDFAPDIIHIHGTEFSHGLAYIKKCGNENVVISLQGVVSGIERYYFGGIPSSTLKHHKHFIDFIDDSISKSVKNIKIRTVNEKQYFTLCNNIIGRTHWDRIHLWSINPNAKYFFCNENLRDPFYENEGWRFDGCEKHTIFVSQSSSPLKGLHKLLESLPIIIKHYPDTQVYVAGKDFVNKKTVREKIVSRPFPNYIVSIINKLGVRDRVHFTGFLNAQEMVNQYLKANVFVCPSSIENSPNSLGEAQLLGVPCIGTFAGGIPDMIKHGQTGMLYRFEEHEELANYIYKLFSNPALCEKLSKNEHVVARERHDRLKNARMLYTIYLSVNNSKKV